MPLNGGNEDYWFVITSTKQIDKSQHILSGVNTVQYFEFPQEMMTMQKGKFKCEIFLFGELQMLLTSQISYTCFILT